MSPPADDAWTMLRELAQADNLVLKTRSRFVAATRPFRDPRERHLMQGVELWFKNPKDGGIDTPVMTVHLHDLIPEEADLVLRQTTAAALAALKGLPR